MSGSSNDEYTSRIKLRAGAALAREQFHYLYSQADPDYRAELIDGIVREPSPLRIAHGTWHLALGWLFQTYVISTPGTQAADNASVFLSNRDEVQPDLLLRINVPHTAKSTVTTEGYVQGAPELIAEISDASKTLDLGLKKSRYLKAGVAEYLVLCLDSMQLHMFNLTNQHVVFDDKNDVFRSNAFPGLWINTKALLTDDKMLLGETLQCGLKSPEHSAFVRTLHFDGFP